MRITKKILDREIAELNDKYCRDTKNKLIVTQSSGGYRVQLTGKTAVDGLCDYAYDVTFGNLPARRVLELIRMRDRSGSLQAKISHCEKLHATHRRYM